MSVPKYISVLNPLTGEIFMQLNPAYVKTEIEEDLPEVPTVPAWALAEEKPEYAANEVGAVSYAAAQNISSTQRKQALDNIQASRRWDKVIDGDTDVSLSTDTLYYFSETLTELSISPTDEFWFGSMAHFSFHSGEPATAVTFNGVAFTGSVEPNSIVDISILGRTAIVNSIPTENFEIVEPNE